MDFQIENGRVFEVSNFQSPSAILIMIKTCFDCYDLNGCKCVYRVRKLNEFVLDVFNDFLLENMFYVIEELTENILYIFR